MNTVDIQKKTFCFHLNTEQIEALDLERGLESIAVTGHYEAHGEWLAGGNYAPRVTSVTGVWSDTGEDAASCILDLVLPEIESAESAAAVNACGYVGEEVAQAIMRMLDGKSFDAELIVQAVKCADSESARTNGKHRFHYAALRVMGRNRIPGGDEAWKMVIELMDQNS